jgi:hypothetical protein
MKDLLTFSPVGVPVVKEKKARRLLDAHSLSFILSRTNKECSSSFCSECRFCLRNPVEVSDSVLNTFKTYCAITLLERGRELNR